MTADQETEQLHILREIAKQLRLTNHLKLLELTGGFKYTSELVQYENPRMAELKKACAFRLPG